MRRTRKRKIKREREGEGERRRERERQMLGETLRAPQTSCDSDLSPRILGNIVSPTL